jgi:hypothetical protein
MRKSINPFVSVSHGPECNFLGGLLGGALDILGLGGGGDQPPAPSQAITYTTPPGGGTAPGGMGSWMPLIIIGVIALLVFSK